MKKRVLNVTTAIILMVSILSTMTGCTLDEIKGTIGGNTVEASTPASNVCVVVSPTANQHKPDVKLAYDEIYDSCYSYGYKSCVVDDGSPYLAFEDDLTHADRTSGLSEQNKKLDAEAYVDDFIEKAENAKAVTSEKDTLKTIRLAADTLVDSEGDKTIILIDNGISTTGIVSFKSFKNFDVEKSINILNDNDYPSLDNVNVVWYGLGDTVAPQKELSNDDMNNLQAFWEQYLTNCGVASVKFPKNVAVNTTVDNSSLPWVSTVDVSPIISKIPNFEALMEQVEELLEEERDSTFDDALEVGFKLDESSVWFKPDSLELVDKDKAVKIMTPLANYLKNNPDKKIVLLGTTATYGNQESCVKFSLGRAETLKRILADDMGVDESQLMTFGLGYENDFHIDDLNDDGSLNEAVALKNRSVIFADADSNIGKSYV